MAIIFIPYGMLVGQFFSNFTVVIGMSFEVDYLLNHKNRDAEVLSVNNNFSPINFCFRKNQIDSWL
jgi:hypothetical protein